MVRVITALAKYCEDFSIGKSMRIEGENKKGGMIYEDDA